MSIMDSLLELRIDSSVSLHMELKCYVMKMNLDNCNFTEQNEKN